LQANENPGAAASLCAAAKGCGSKPDAWTNAKLSAYWREMNIPASLAEDMSRIEPSKMRVLSPEELARYRLD
jgi:hypothetical protein